MRIYLKNATEFCFSREKRKNPESRRVRFASSSALLSSPIFCIEFFSKYILHCSAWWSGPSSEMPQLVPLHPQPEISLTRAKYESTPQKSRCHVRSHHSPDRSVHACIQIRRGPTWRNEIPVDRDDPGWLLRVRCRNGAKKRTLTRSHARTFGLCA